MNNLITSLDHFRKTIGFGVDMCCEVDFRLAPGEALVLAKAIEPFRLFWLEELFVSRMSAGIKRYGGSAACRSLSER